MKKLLKAMVAIGAVGMAVSYGAEEPNSVGTAYDPSARPAVMNFADICRMAYTMPPSQEEVMEVIRSVLITDLFESVIKDLPPKRKKNLQHHTPAQMEKFLKKNYPEEMEQFLRKNFPNEVDPFLSERALKSSKVSS